MTRKLLQCLLRIGQDVVNMKLPRKVDHEKICSPGGGGGCSCHYAIVGYIGDSL